jgi:hypothetical protein
LQHSASAQPLWQLTVVAVAAVMAVAVAVLVAVAVAVLVAVVGTAAVLGAAVVLRAPMVLEAVVVLREAAGMAAVLDHGDAWGEWPDYTGRPDDHSAGSRTCSGLEWPQE